MDIVGVIDLLGGRAVHARGGRREDYAPVERVAGVALAPGDAAALAQVYVERLAVTTLYVADLDAILGGSPQDTLVERLTAPGAAVWLDQGVASVAQARHARDLGAARVIVGLETLPSWEVLAGICTALGSARVAFSLDLRNGVPVVTGDRLLRDGSDAPTLAARAARAGAGALIVLDLERVGRSAGLDAWLIARVRQAVPHVRLLAGGGVRSRDDLVQLAREGCDGALVATALHTGGLGADDVRAARLFPG